jgi:hypothetical protein
MSSNPAEATPLPGGISANALSSLFGAINGLRNRRAVIAMMGCLVGGVLVAGLLSQLGAFMTFLGVLIWIVAAGTGVNAAGLLHMDDARGISPRSTVDALVQGLMCIPKLIALAILLFLVELAVFLVIAIVLFICKIPFLGPVLFTVAFPVSVVVAGITVLGLSSACCCRYRRSGRARRSCAPCRRRWPSRAAGSSRRSSCSRSCGCFRAWSP